MAALAALGGLAGAGGAAAGGISLGGIGSLLGTGFSVIGSLVQGAAAQKAANMQAAIARMNADIAEDNARRSIHKGQGDQQDQDAQTAAFVGQQIAEQGASGVSVGSKSAQLVRKTARQLGRKDALNVRNDAELRAFNFKAEAANQRASSKVFKAQGKSSMLAAFFNAGSSLISGASSVTSKSRLRPRSFAT